MGNKAWCSSTSPNDIAFSNYDIASEVYTAHAKNHLESQIHLEKDLSSLDKLDKHSITSATETLVQSRDSLPSHDSPKPAKKTDSDTQSDKQAAVILQQIESTLKDTSKTVILQGELLRYRPGDKTRFIPRWCKCTRTHLHIYKNRISAVSEEKPLVSVPLNYIKQAVS